MSREHPQPQDEKFHNFDSCESNAPQRGRWSGDDGNLINLSFDRMELGATQAPDLTHRIMGRLGYMRVAPGVSQRRRIRQWIGRSGVLLSAALALTVGIQVHENSEDVRRPDSITIPAAIGNDLERHQHRIGNVINTIRRLSVPASLDEPADDHEQLPDMPHEDVNQSALSVYRWV